METGTKQYDTRIDIFAGTGALLLFKRNTLEDIKEGDEYLDEDFFLL